MNERIKLLAEQAKFIAEETINKKISKNAELDAFAEKFAELIVRECVGILETEIDLVNGYKSTARNDFDIKWHQGKITHFTKLIEKSKKHFGEEE